MIKDLIVYWVPLLAWMAFIFPANSMLEADSTSHIIVPILKWLLPRAGPAAIDILHFGIRKFAHFFSYAFLAVLLFRAFRAGKKTVRPEWIVYAGLVAVCYAALDEYLQTLTASRTGSLYDWMIDSAGTVVTLLIITRVSFIKMRKENA